jgi:hypothetical protein
VNLDVFPIKNGFQKTETHFDSLCCKWFGLVAAAASAATTAASAAVLVAATTSAAAAAAGATAAATAAGAGEHGVVDHKPNLSTQVLNVIYGCLFQEGSAV